MKEVVVLKEPSQDVLLSLKRLASDTCVYPGCEKKAHTVVSILANRKDSPCFENSVILCEEHALSCKQGEIKGELLLRLRELLRAGRGLITEPENEKHELTSRAEYLERIADEVPKAKSIRCIYVGPLPFHPAWYFQMMVGKTNMKSMDAAISDALEDPNISVKMIIRNDSRYIEKCKSDVPFELRKPMIEEICKRYEQLRNPSLNNIIEIWNPGIYHIPIILDDCCIFAFRSRSNTPIEGGFLTKDKKQIRWEQESFDQIMAYNKDRVGDATVLRDFLNQMLTD